MHSLWLVSALDWSGRDPGWIVGIAGAMPSRPAGKRGRRAWIGAACNISGRMTCTCVANTPFIITAFTIPRPRSAMSTDAAEPVGRLQAAVAAHRAGRLDEAEEHYRVVLAQEPDNQNALHLMGVVHRQRGRPESAAALITQALQY